MMADSTKSTDDDLAAETPRRASASKKGVSLRYLGTSHVFEDYVTGLRFVAGGDPIDVDPDVATRLETTSGDYDRFERVSA